jgi:hypothetical protein
MNLPRDDQQQPNFRPSLAACPNRCGSRLEFSEVSNGLVMRCVKCRQSWTAEEIADLGVDA